MGRHADRIAAVHLQRHAARPAAATKATMPTCSELNPGPPPGTGPNRAAGMLISPPPSPRCQPDFAGWVIVEVDVPEAPSNLESAQISAAWVVDHYGPDVF